MNSNYSDYSNHGPIDRDAQRLSQELDAVRARTGRSVTPPGATAAHRRTLLARLRTAVTAIREVFDGVAEANERYDRMNRPWIYEGPAWVDGAHVAVRISHEAVADDAARQPRSGGRPAPARGSDAARTGLRHAH